MDVSGSRRSANQANPIQIHRDASLRRTVPKPVAVDAVGS